MTKCLILKKPSALIAQELSNANFQLVTDGNWDMFWPRFTNKLATHLQAVEVTSDHQVLAGILGTDHMVSKKWLWIQLVKTYGISKARLICPDTMILTIEGDAKRLRALPRNTWLILKGKAQKRQGLTLLQTPLIGLDAWILTHQLAQRLVSPPDLIDGYAYHQRYYLALSWKKGHIDAFVFPRIKWMYCRSKYPLDDSMQVDSLFTDSVAPPPQGGVSYSAFDKNDKVLSHISAIVNSQLPIIKKHTNAMKTGRWYQHFGIDIVRDQHGHPYVLEVNKGPDMVPTNEPDKDFKSSLLSSLIDAYTRDDFSSWIALPNRS